MNVAKKHEARQEASKAKGRHDGVDAVPSTEQDHVTDADDDQGVRA